MDQLLSNAKPKTKGRLCRFVPPGGEFNLMSKEFGLEEEPAGRRSLAERIMR
ncbi:hypothetical protein [Leptospira fainei]|uniref:hypothetical protein n=1 Tax=Leptospira fainei TaxID=48782 RepID=UPI0002F3FE51|nr:hypothetical protein [Leptospira fainei]